MYFERERERERLRDWVPFKIHQIGRNKTTTKTTTTARNIKVAAIKVKVVSVFFGVKKKVKQKSIDKRDPVQ